METSRSSMNLEQNFRDMMSDAGAWDDYLADIQGTAAEVAWTAAIDDWVANGGNAYDWYQDMLASFPDQKQVLFDIYKRFLDKYGFAEATGAPDPGTMSRPNSGRSATNVTSAGSSMWPTNEAAFIAVAVGILAIAVYALKEK
jgi:hypothetical protein